MRQKQKQKQKEEMRFIQQHRIVLNSILINDVLSENELHAVVHCANSISGLLLSYFLLKIDGKYLK